jgi:hypothetical protein
MLKRWAHKSTCADAATLATVQTFDALVAGFADIDIDSST